MLSMKTKLRITLENDMFLGGHCGCIDRREMRSVAANNILL